MKVQKILTACLLMATLFVSQQSLARTTVYSEHVLHLAGDKFRRTELYFGTGKPDGTTVTEAEWSKFIDEEVTSRFPDGFTVIDGDGQFRGADGKVIKEKSKILILLYPSKDRESLSVKIEEIRTAYKKAFQQESVMRVDLGKAVTVAF